MQQTLTQEGQNLVNDLASRYNLSTDTVIYMIGAVNRGGGSMAQFNAPQLGGSGQWMRGGMTMVGDMFNYGLQGTVDNLCSEISNTLNTMQVFPPLPTSGKNTANWWQSDLGSPSSSGGQNNTRYAVFPNRLAVELNGVVTIYDTLDNNIGGVSQQQGGDNSLTFSSQYGTIAVSSLPVISTNGTPPAPQNNFVAPTPNVVHEQPIQNNPEPLKNQTNDNIQPSQNITQMIEQLASLHTAGILTDEEFTTKKAELLNRI
ncbi:MAG: Unknown protein [uncultured Sulfurovum sp.]|uniref:SHOCT domain-containing protein n=1 Tax=uncultured Sulfurovum sp. TaxID=269237 RepID=A0A6S6UBD7_9BACT|nr:MAG: Unknown protein [uncultured Sulfurovum sp.]